MKIVTSLALALLLCEATWGQYHFSGSIGSVSGVTIKFRSKVEPPSTNSQPVTHSGTGPLMKGVVVGMWRYSANANTHEYFGYDMKVEPIDQSAGTYRLTFSVLTLTPEELKLPDPKSWRLLPAPIFPPPQQVNTMDTIAFDLFENPATGQKVVDYIQLEPESCDAKSAVPGQVGCLSGLVQAARRTLQNSLTEVGKSRDAATADSIRTSQLTWEKYRDDACGRLGNEVKRLECELKLTQSRIHDLSELYGS